MAVSWHTLASDAVASTLRANLDTGLTEDEAQRRLAEYGPNILPEPDPPNPLTVFLTQFSNLIVWVLIGAAVVSGILQEWIDAVAILAIVLLNAGLGFVQEYRAEQSLAALKKLSVTMARIIRDGVLSSIPARDVVPGDLIQIEAGDHVPADARIVYATGLRTQEAALTGESTPVDKFSDPLSGDSLPIAEQANRLFLGTAVSSGKGRALVVATGRQTELGHIATLMQSAEREPTPLQRRDFESRSKEDGVSSVILPNCLTRSTAVTIVTRSSA